MLDYQTYFLSRHSYHFIKRQCNSIVESTIKRPTIYITFTYSFPITVKLSDICELM